MISKTLKFKFVTNIGSDPIISELIKTFEIQRPIQRSLAPKWDLACVLSSLRKDPYEPSHKGLLHLTVKTVFLLTMATAKPVSEIHALAMDTEHLRSDKTDGSVSLRTRRGFLAKYQPSKSPLTIFIPNLAKTLNRENDNWLLCPVRALKCYLDKTTLERTGLDCSFLSREITILQKDRLHGGLHLRSRCHIRNLREICHSLKSKPTN